VNLNILAADIGKRGIVAVWVGFEDQRALAPVSPLPKEASTQMQAKFQDMLKRGTPATGVDFYPGKVVNPPVALADDLRDLANTNLSAIRRIKRAPRVVAG